MSECLLRTKFSNIGRYSCLNNSSFYSNMLKTSRLSLISAFLLLALCFHAQTTDSIEFVPITKSDDANVVTEDDVDDVIFTIVEEMPQFPGGDEAFVKYAEERAKYPDDIDAKEKVKGVVFLKFAIDREGSVMIDETKVLRGLNPTLDQIAVDIINGMPKWEPGRQNKKEVNVYMVMPIKFK